jgi:hypothetical protein
VYGQRRIGRVFSGAMAAGARNRAARPAWRKRLTRLWVLTLVLAVASRASYRLGWPVPVTTTLLVIAIALALALLVRRITSYVGEHRSANR